MLKEIREDLSKWENILCSWIWGLNNFCYDGNTVGPPYPDSTFMDMKDLSMNILYIHYTLPFYIGDLSIYKFWYIRKVLEPISTDTRDNCTPQSGLQIQCNSYQNFNDLIYRNEKVDLQITMEFLWILNSQNNLEKIRTNLEDWHFLISKFT